MDSTSSQPLPTVEDVREAAARIEGEAVRTPLLLAHRLSLVHGRPVLIKPECLQRTGSFKFRGAHNRISRLAGTDVDSVVACSSGNHAQGVAAAATLAGLKATIVMPSDAPAIKCDNTRALGATVVPYDRDRDDRNAIARRITDEQGAVFVPPYDDPHIIAGQGTVGLEIAEDCTAMGLSPEAVLVPAGGGGLCAGVGLAVKDAFPDSRIHTCEPEGFDDHARSLQCGAICANSKVSGSICDALLAPSPGEITFALNVRNVESGLVVSDAAATRAMAVAFADLKLVVEPGGAVALAALLENRLPEGKGTVVIVLSGGNVDPATYSDCLTRARDASAAC